MYTCITPLEVKTRAKNTELEQISPFLWEMEGTQAGNGFPLETKCPVMFFFNVYSFLRDTQTRRKRGRDREGQREI